MLITALNYEKEMNSGAQKQLLLCSQRCCQQVSGDTSDILPEAGTVK